MKFCLLEMSKVVCYDFTIGDRSEILKVWLYFRVRYTMGPKIVRCDIKINKKTPEGAYAGRVGLRKNYGYVGWKWKLSSVCNKCVQERRRCSVKD